MKIDRNSVIDAKYIFENFLPDKIIREKIIEFLYETIIYANNFNNENWNLNLDVKGKFIRLNIGQVYCIEIDKKEILVLCDRQTLKPLLSDMDLLINFRGHINKEKIHSKNIDEVPDCLAKVKNSIGCIVKNTEVDALNLFRQSNFDFTNNALKTKISSIMKKAHSKGAIEYLAKIIVGNITNPIYAISDLITLKQLKNNENREIKKAKKISKKKRQEILRKSTPKPSKTFVTQPVYKRNPYVIVEVLERANGICEKCHKPAPFFRDVDNTPYLEVHHKIPLSEGGNDTVNNAIALCPNCHRQVHYGKKSF